MAQETVRAHLSLPKDLVESVDEIVGSRGRSRFVADAVAEKLRRVKLADAAARVAGSLADVDIRGWESSRAAAEWVRASRRASDERLGRTREDA